jgi:hypothetical protein
MRARIARRYFTKVFRTLTIFSPEATPDDPFLRHLDGDFREPGQSYRRETAMLFFPSCFQNKWGGRL